MHCFWLWTSLLFAGCVLIPVDQIRFGSMTIVNFSADHVPYATKDVFFSHEVHASELCETCHAGHDHGGDVRRREEGARRGGDGIA